ncbi:MAG: hypothetical protein QMB63_07585 [Clostridiaceae bacterium]
MILIVDYKTPQNEILKLERFGPVFKSDKVTALSPIDGHPDMQIHVIDDTVFVHKNISERLLKELKRNSNKNVIVTNYEIKPQYPSDIGLNCLSTFDVFIHDLKRTAPELLSYIKSKNLNCIHVKQGYTACSTLSVGKNAFITSDKGIFKTLTNNNKNTLYTDPEGIVLDGMGNGFIGGSMRIIKQENVNFLVSFGDPNNLKDFDRIIEFMKAEIGDVTLFPLSSGPLYDRGGITIIQD